MGKIEMAQIGVTFVPELLLSIILCFSKIHNGKANSTQL